MTRRQATDMEARARVLAKDTAVELGLDYCVLKDHWKGGEFHAYSRDFIEFHLACGEISSQEQVIVCYDAEGQEFR